METAILDRGQLQERADRGVRRIALSLLRNANEACETLQKAAAKPGKKSASADDALHDFRVAVRRVRSWSRAFHSSLQGSISRKQRRHLGELFHDTGVARDAAVHLAWMRGQLEKLNTSQRVGPARLVHRLKTAQEAGWIATLSAARRFEAMSPKLARRLNTYRSMVDDQPPVRVGVVISQRLRDQSDDLQAALGAIEDARDEVPIHHARIAAKRLRYVAEQVAKLVQGGDALVETLEHLQDVLGNLHDVHVFSATIADGAEQHSPSRTRGAASAQSRDAGILALTQRLHERGRRAFAIVERDWLSGRAAPFFARVREMADEVTRLARLGTEIERKYLLAELPEKLRGAESVEIRQGYLPGEHLVERIRCEGIARARQRWTRTVKLGVGVERIEIEDETEAAVGRSLWRLTRGRRVHKRRYSIREDDGAVWEVDEFLDRPLILAEIELTSADVRPKPPAWLRGVLEREVTEEPEFTNARLAK